MKTYTFYGNSTSTADIAFLTAITFAKKGYKTLFIELGEGNAQITYQLGIEEQRVKTTDYYILGHQKNHPIQNCILTIDSIKEFLLDKEKDLRKEIEELPKNLSILLKKTQPEEKSLNEEEWQQVITRMIKEGQEEHDIMILSTKGRTLSYSVFFPLLLSDEAVLILEDKPEDLRIFNSFIIDLQKIRETFHPRAILLSHSINIEKEHYKKTKINIMHTFSLKALQKIKLSTWNGYNVHIEEIDQVYNCLTNEKDSPKRHKFSWFNKKKEKRR
ncbi:MAG: hypothetical protein AB2421_18320 [Thermotaleaceae bacterium]